MFAPISEEKTDYLIKEYDWIIHDVLSKHCFNQNDRDDCYNLGVEKLIASYQAYDRNNEYGAEYRTFAYKSVKNAIIRHMTRETKRRSHEVYISETKFGDTNVPFEDWVQDMKSHDVRDDSGGMPLLYDHILSTGRLSGRQLKILKMRYKGMTLEEIGEKIGITREGVRKSLLEIAKKLEKPLCRK